MEWRVLIPWWSNRLLYYDCFIPVSGGELATQCCGGWKPCDRWLTTKGGQHWCKFKGCKLHLKYIILTVCKMTTMSSCCESWCVSHQTHLTLPFNALAIWNQWEKKCDEIRHADSSWYVEKCPCDMWRNVPPPPPLYLSLLPALQWCQPCYTHMHMYSNSWIQ